MSQQNAGDIYNAVGVQISSQMARKGCTIATRCNASFNSIFKLHAALGSNYRAVKLKGRILLVGSQACWVKTARRQGWRLSWHLSRLIVTTVRRSWSLFAPNLVQQNCIFLFPYKDWHKIFKHFHIKKLYKFI